LHIPPWTILAGLGTLTRQELCQLLPHFEDTNLPNIAADKFRNIAAKFDRSSGSQTEAAFKQRLIESSERIMTSKATDGALRVRLWDHLLSAFEIEASLPLSTRVANAKSVDLAYHAALTLSDQLKSEKEAENRSLPEEAWKRLTAIFSKGEPDFSAIVVARAEIMARAVAEAAQRGALGDDDKAELAKRVREQIEELPPELRGMALEQALKSGDTAIIGLLASGTSLVGMGIAVKLAGFSAYIFAAQAAAIIPFVGGSATVSMLFVLANPLFIGPVILGGAYLAGKHVKGVHAKRLSSNMAVQLALKGIAAGRAGLRTTLDNFKNLSASDFDTLPEKRRSKLLTKLTDVRERIGSPLPLTPWPPEGILAKPVKDDAGTALHQILFAKNGGNASEALIVGGLTAGDILYDAAAIDPTVLRAADFSRSEEISDIFDFGIFSDRIGSMAVESVAGAGNNLRGYVAEQIVATRLVEQGHVVTFPDTSNNPGFDLLVDGHAFQVKCLAGISGLREHFEKYPDMPVFANSELAEAVAATAESWAGKVFYVEGFDREITDFIMEAALDAGASLGDMDVPYFAVAVSTAKNLFGWWQGRIPLADLPFSVVLDGAVKGGLATAGGFSGNILGMLLFGPAGALIFGGVGGAGAILASHWTRQQVTRLISGDWLKSLDEATNLLRRALIAEIQGKIKLLTEKRSQIAIQGHEQDAWFLARVSDDIVALAEHIYELEHEIAKHGQPERARMCLQSTTEASVHPWAVQQELSAVLNALKQQPSLTEATSRKAMEAWDALKLKMSQKSWHRR
jgi:hypothetical protein